MPALDPTLLSNILSIRNTTNDSANANSTDDVMQVICAWPVSGQYGPGSRILYYALVAACVFARKYEWLRNACLAAALVFPAVAAVHGIVLAAIHVDNAVDMDIYGTFQFCSIAILAAPLTVRISRTYFDDPGRNIIFIWTGLILAGLLSLTVEFFRITTSGCTVDNNHNNIIPNDYANFPYENVSCNLTCSSNSGPFSPLRQGSANEIYIIPAPNILTFNAATLLAAACCIPAVLSLVSMWNKILEINWKTKFGRGDEDQLIEGTNGATVAKMSRVNTIVRLFLSTVEVPVFTAAVLALLIFGEKNFFSHQVNYQTEPIASIGQWSPIVATGFAALGSLYVLLAVDMEALKGEVDQTPPLQHFNYSHPNFSGGQPPSLDNQSGADTSPSSEGLESDVPESSQQVSRSPPAIREISNGLSNDSSNSVTAPRAACIRSSSSLSRRDTPPEMSIADTPHTTDVGHRRRVFRTMVAASNFFTAAEDRFDYSEFKTGKALDFPEVPAEELRNPDLPHIREVYNVPPSLRHKRSRSTCGGRAGSIASRESGESSAIVERRRAGTLPAGSSSVDSDVSASPSTAESMRGRLRERRDTLEVPASRPLFHTSSRSSKPASPAMPTTTISNSHGSPVIVIFPDPDTSPPPIDDTSALDPPVTQSSSESAPSSKTT